jgi:hypothetical protein
MSDRLDEAFEVLRGQQPPAPFAPAEAVRRRGHRRTVRQAVAVALAVLAVTGAGVGWAAGLAGRGPDQGPAGGGSPTPATSQPAPTPLPSSPGGSGGVGTASPTPTGLAGRLLRPADLGPGAWQPVHGDSFESADRWYWANLCPAYRSADYPSLRAMAAVEVTGYGDGTRYVHEHLHRYRAGSGPRAIGDIRALLGRCAGPTAPPTSPGAPAPTHYAVVDTGFTGDEALLVREDAWAYDNTGKIGPTPSTRLIAVVRVGDLVATVLLSPERDAAAARTLAATAADQLRAP